MTVETTTIVSGPYTGDNTADEYSYLFRVETKNQLTVFETDADGAITTLTVDTDYTVGSVGNDSGGLITRVAGNLPTGYTWYIRANYLETQDVDLASQGAFYPSVHEAAFDKLTFLSQQQGKSISQSARLPDSYSGAADAALPTPVADGYLKWSADALTLENDTILPAAVSEAAASAAAALVSENAAAASEVLAADQVSLATDEADDAAESAVLAASYAVFSKLDATSAPTANDDGANTSGDGIFVIGSSWVNVTSKIGYKCVDATATAAVWKVSTVVEASTTVKGIVEKSTSGENIAGSSNLVYPTVAGTKQMIDTHSASGLSGAESITPASNAELSSSVLLHEVACSADNLEINMPAGSDYTVGLLAAIIKNTGSKKFTLNSKNAGTTFGEVWPGETIRLTLSASSTDGTWIAENGRFSIKNESLIVFENAATEYTAMAKIGTNKIIIVYEDDANSDYLTAVAIRWVDGVADVGAPLVIDNEQIYLVTVCATDVADEAIACAVDAGNELNAYKLSVSGVTITLEATRNGVATGVITSAHYSPSVVMTSADTFVCGYHNTSQHPYVVAFTTTGHTINAAGTPLAVFGANAGRNIRVKVSGVDEVVVAWQFASTSIYAEPMTVSGNTMTGGSTVTFATGAAGGLDQTILGNGIGIIAAADSASGEGAWNELHTYTVISSAVAQVSHIRANNYPSEATEGFPRVAAVGNSQALLFSPWVAQGKQQHYALASVTDSGEIKILEESLIGRTGGNDTYTQAGRTDFIQLDDGICVMCSPISGLADFGCIQVTRVLGSI